MRHEVPRLFGRYLLEEYLAAGGMAEVYIARIADDPAGRRLCVKCVLPHLTGSADFLTMFKDEAELAARLNDDNVVRVLEAGEAEGVLFMVMELVEGADLAGLFKALRKQSQGFTVAEAVAIARGMCRGLHHAHTLVADDGHLLGVVHRDVSPQNVLIDVDGSVKVTDFGIAKSRFRSTQTQTGIIKGKVAYMAPEQALGEKLDPRVDQFATATVLWEMLTGQRLFHDKSDLLTLEKIIRRPTDPPSSFRSDVSRALDRAILKGLAKRPAERFENLAHFERALAGVFSEVAGGRSEHEVVARLMRRALDLVDDPAPGAEEEEGESLTKGIALTAPRLATGSREVAKTRVTPSSPAELPVELPVGLPADAAAKTRPLVSPNRGRPSRSYEPPRPAQDAAAEQAGRPGTPVEGGAGRLFVLPASAQLPGGASTPSDPLRPAGYDVAPIRTGLAQPASERVFVERGVPKLLLAGVLLAGALLGFGGGYMVRGVDRMCAPRSAEANVRQMADTLLSAAELARANAEWETMGENLRRSLRMHGSARGYAMLGQVRAMQGDIPSALDAYRCVIELEPDSKEAAAVRAAVEGP